MCYTIFKIDLNEYANLNDSDFNNSIYSFERAYRNKNVKICFKKYLY